jgi:signal transduction histidine kinase
MLAALAGAAEDIRRSLSVIRGFADYYRSGRAQAPADLARMMARVDEESARMASAAGRLENAAGQEPGSAAR